jgi:LysR family glycine cleavage system transcriptional activator
MKRLPSLDSLRAFEAVARHLSVTQAAHELHVTPSALSQRIHALEDELGYRLFLRRHRALALTDPGRRLADAMARAMAEIAHAFATLEELGAAPAITISVLPSFAARWLMPRLPRFQAAHPHLQVQVNAEGRLVDMTSSDADCAVRFGNGNYPGLRVDRLMDDHVTPVAAPASARQGGGLETMLSRARLLNDSAVERDESGTDWRTWCAHFGVAHPRRTGALRFSQADLLLQAAEQGLGIALARLSLVGDALRAGTLVELAPDKRLRANYGYYLVALPEKSERPAVAAFRQWLIEECRAFAAQSAPA